MFVDGGTQRFCETWRSLRLFDNKDWKASLAPQFHRNRDEEENQFEDVYDDVSEDGDETESVSDDHDQDADGDESESDDEIK